MSDKVYDIAIIGGGINGCGIARDAAGRGLSVVLFEQRGLASGTSSASTKLIHGGLRYLEQYQFGLVREALREREIIWRIAPHIVRPMRFVLPHRPSVRSATLIRMGLWLYDRLGGSRKLPPSRSLRLEQEDVGTPLQQCTGLAFEYSDCWVEDARLVILNARDAANRGATIRPHTEVTSATRTPDYWLVESRDVRSGANSTITARVLVNATGPWVNTVIANCLRANAPAPVRLVKGAHIIVPKLFSHNKAYLLQAPDRRVVFAVPYETDYTLIGTTETEFVGDPAEVAIADDEKRYLCEIANASFNRQCNPDQVVWSFSGVRPLQESTDVPAREASRGYSLIREGNGNQPAVLHVLGGKITTYRHLAEKALHELADAFPNAGKNWTHLAPLPGGDFPLGGAIEFSKTFQSNFPTLSQALRARLVNTYGTRATDIAEALVTAKMPCPHFGAELFAPEVEYLRQNEWATTADDVLWRHTKLGLHTTLQQQHALQQWFAGN